jgi:hypothetical protein
MTLDELSESFGTQGRSADGFWLRGLSAFQTIFEIRELLAQHFSTTTKSLPVRRDRRRHLSLG